MAGLTLVSSCLVTLDQEMVSSINDKVVVAATFHTSPTISCAGFPRVGASSVPTPVACAGFSFQTRMSVTGPVDLLVCVSGGVDTEFVSLAG